MSLDLVPNRIYAQYRGKERFTKWINILRRQGESIDEAAQKVAASYLIDSAEGAQLDVIGRIVVIDRNFINRITMKTAMCGDKSTQCGSRAATTFSQTDVASDSAMSDALFRLIIKAKILKNNKSATLEDLIEQMNVLIGVDFVRINNPENMTFTIEFSGVISPLQRYALFNENIIQIPQGVQFNGFRELTSLVMFDDKEFMAGDVFAQSSNLGGV